MIHGRTILVMVKADSEIDGALTLGLPLNRQSQVVLNIIISWSGSVRICKPVSIIFVITAILFGIGSAVSILAVDSGRVITLISRRKIFVRVVIGRVILSCDQRLVSRRPLTDRAICRGPLLFFSWLIYEKISILTP